jgi:hypothetical protein
METDDDAVEAAKISDGAIILEVLTTISYETFDRQHMRLP